MKRLDDVGIMLLVSLAAALTLAVSLYHVQPIGWDIHWHLKVARIWASGGNGMFSDVVMQTNKIPYPPVFHWLLVPSIWLGVELDFARVLQVVFYPLALATSMFVVWKIRASKEQALLTGFYLVSAFGFYDHLIQAFPQSLDMALYPLALYFYLKGDKPYWWILIAGLLVWSHGFAALALLGGLALMSVKEKPVEFFELAAVSSPVALLSVVYLAPALGRWAGSDSLAERMFWQNPITYAFWYLGIPLSLSLAFVVYRLWQHINKSTQVDRLDWISILTLLTLIPLGLFWQDRYFSYAALPLSFIAARFTAESKRLKPYIILVLLILATLYYIDYWLAIFSNAYEVLPV